MYNRFLVDEFEFLCSTPMICKSRIEVQCVLKCGIGLNQTSPHFLLFFLLSFTEY